MLPSYDHTITLPPDHNAKWLKSFSVPSQGFRHILSSLPLRQGSLPKNKWTTGNNFSTSQRGKKMVAPPKPHFFEKKSTPKIFEKILSNFFFRRRKMKSCKSSETRFAKVSRRSELCSRGKRPFKVSQKSFRGASRNRNIIHGYKINTAT